MRSSSPHFLLVESEPQTCLRTEQTLRVPTRPPPGLSASRLTQTDTRLSRKRRRQTGSTFRKTSPLDANPNLTTNS